MGIFQLLVLTVMTTSTMGVGTVVIKMGTRSSSKRENFDFSILPLMFIVCLTKSNLVMKRNGNNKLMRINRDL